MLMLEVLKVLRVPVRRERHWRLGLEHCVCRPGLSGPAIVGRFERWELGIDWELVVG